MTELELLRAFAKHKLLKHPKNEGVLYRMLYISRMHNKDGEWVDAMVYQNAEDCRTTYVRPVTEFGKFTAVDKVAQVSEF